MEGQITKAGDKHCWKFEAEDMNDFAFAVSNEYLWNATSTIIEGKRVLVNGVYNKTSKNFEGVAEICRKSIDYYSNVQPAIPYPYPQLTAFNGGTKGMEFPAMINDQEESDEIGTLFVPEGINKLTDQERWIRNTISKGKIKSK